MLIQIIELKWCIGTLLPATCLQNPLGWNAAPTAVWVIKKSQQSNTKVIILLCVQDNQEWSWWWKGRTYWLLASRSTGANRGKKKNKNKNTTNMENNFLTSCVGSFLAKFYTSPQIKGYREIFSSQTIQLLSYLGVLLLSRISLPTRRTLLKVHWR